LRRQSDNYDNNDGACVATSGASGIHLGNTSGYFGCYLIGGMEFVYGVFSSSDSNSVAFSLHSSATEYVEVVTYRTD
jgi:hypothetical protein